MIKSALSVQGSNSWSTRLGGQPQGSIGDASDGKRFAKWSGEIRFDNRHETSWIKCIHLISIM